MPISADQMRELMTLGVEGELLLKIVTIFERDASRDGRDGKAMAADRARKYRARLAQKKLGMAELEADTSRHADRHVMRHVTGPAAPLSFYPSSLPLLVGKEETKKEEPSASQVEGRKRSRRKTAIQIPDDWQPTPEHFEAARKRNVSREAVVDLGEAMRQWAKSKDEHKADWNATFHGFIRRAKDQIDGPRGPKPFQNGRQHPSDLALDLADEARRLERQAGIVR